MSDPESPYAPPAANPVSVADSLAPPAPRSLWGLGAICSGVLVAGLWVVPAFRTMYFEVGVVETWASDLVFGACELPYFPLVVLLPLWVGYALRQAAPRALPWFVLGWGAVCIGLTAWGLFSPLLELHQKL